MFDTDFSELDQLSADLGAVPGNAGRYVTTAVTVTARHVKDDWAEKLEGENGLPHAPRSIGYDVTSFQGFGNTVVKAEIGAERGKLQAPIVTVIEYGSPVNNTPPRGYGHGALQENEDDFVKGLSKALEDAENAQAIDSSFLRNVGAVLNGGTQ